MLRQLLWPAPTISVRADADVLVPIIIQRLTASQSPVEDAADGDCSSAAHHRDGSSGEQAADTEDGGLVPWTEIDLTGAGLTDAHVATLMQCLQR